MSDLIYSFIHFFPDPGTGQSKTPGNVWRRHRSGNRNRAAGTDWGGPEEVNLRGRRAESENGSEKWAGKPRGDWGARGAARRQSTEGRRDVGRQPGGAIARGGGRGGSRGRDREGAEWRKAEVRMERRGGGDQKYDAGNRNPGSFGAPRSAQGPGLGYKKLEELSKQDPSVVALSLSNHPALEDVLKESKMKKEPIELLCLVMSNAFRSRADRSTLLHLAGIIKDSNFFRIVLPYYLTDVESERNCTRRTQYPEHMGNILTIMSEVSRSCE